MSDSKNNTGKDNSGYYNSGYYNSGHYNSGGYNSGGSNSGYFNTDEPFVRLFNKETTVKRSELRIPYITLKLTEWDAKNNKLITRTYKEAWKLYWDSATKEDKQLFLSLPNFDAAIFEEITGVKVNAKPETCDNKTVIIDGKEYILKLKE